MLRLAGALVEPRLAAVGQVIACLDRWGLSSHQKEPMDDQWITFDCFGTLVDWNGGFRRILEPLAGDAVDRLIESYHHFERATELESPHRLYRDVLATSLARAAEVRGIRCDRHASAVIAESWGLLRPFADVEPALASLRQNGFRLGVLTNCGDDLFEITHRQFRNRFDLVVTAEQVMDYKPSLSHFRRFLRTTDAGPGNWFHVACSWYHDIVPAAKLGIPSAWLDRDQTGEDPSFATVRIERASQLEAAIGSLRMKGA